PRIGQTASYRRRSTSEILNCTLAGDVLPRCDTSLEGGMDVIETSLPGVVILRPMRHGDARGYFSETYNKRGLVALGIDVEFVQDSHSRSERAGTVRGLHYQLPPHGQAKLMRVIRGSVFDVALDIRRDSPTFGRHVSTVLTADEGNQIFVPAGF